MDEEKHAHKNISKSTDKFNQPNSPIFGRVDAGNVLTIDELMIVQLIDEE